MKTKRNGVCLKTGFFTEILTLAIAGKFLIIVFLEFLVIRPLLYTAFIVGATIGVMFSLSNFVFNRIIDNNCKKNKKTLPAMETTDGLKNE